MKPELVAPASEYHHQLDEQKAHARVIQFRTDKLALHNTINDYIDEFTDKRDKKELKDAVEFLTPVALTGIAGDDSYSTGAATATLKAMKKEGRVGSPEVIVLDSWVEYLTEVAELREAGHTLSPIEEGTQIGFIDDDGTQITISIMDIRAERKRVKADPSLIHRYSALVNRLGLKTAEEVLTASQSPATRAFILGPSEYGWQSEALDTEDKPVEEMWVDSTGGSFLKVVPEIGTEDRTLPVEDVRL